MMWAVASAAESVIVITKSVATNPSSTRTKSLLFQRENNASSIAIEPSPFGLSVATRLYIGSAPKSVRSTTISVAIGDNAAAATKAMPG